jgi:hypothetical protein
MATRVLDDDREAFDRAQKEIQQLPTDILMQRAWYLYMIAVDQLIITHQVGVYYKMPDGVENSPICLPSIFSLRMLKFALAGFYSKQGGNGTSISPRDFASDLFSVARGENLRIALLVEGR